MNLYDLLIDKAEAFADSVISDPIPWPDPLDCDSFVARSAMQKSIRRGDERVALRSAATVMLSSPAIVWRRLLVTSLEDLGIYEVAALTKIAAAIERRRYGHKLDQWASIAATIRVCCAASRCQAANDLINLATNGEEYARFRQLIAGVSPRDILSFTTDVSQDIVERCIAALTLMGNECAPWTLSGRLSEPELVIAACGQNVAPDVRTIYNWAWNKSRLSLAIASVLLASTEINTTSTPYAFDDAIPPCGWVGDIPDYAMDQYTRVGRAAISEFIRDSAEWGSFAKDLSLGKTVQFKAAGELLFRAEGAVVTRRASWDLGRILRDKSMQVGCFIAADAVPHGLALITSNLSLLGDLRMSHFRRSRCNQLHK